jgi:stage II sporulation protein D
MKRIIQKTFIFFLLMMCNVLFSTSVFADPTIRVLLLDGKNNKVPQRNEKVERLGNTKGEVLLSGLKYSGAIEVWKGENGLYIVNEVPFEEYIKGVVAGEVGSSWDIEALKAQAVVARTYALYQKLNNGVHKLPFHLTSSVLHQVYKGGNIHPNIIKAVNDTRGEILTYDGKPIVAYYHSTSGGMTEDSLEVFGKSYPYLKPVQSSGELSPYYMWEKRVPMIDIEKAVNLSGIKNIEIESFTASNRARNLKITSDAGEIKLPAKDVRRLVGWDKLPSTMITRIFIDNDAIIFEGKGYGHGVGMCQWSALDMAKSGATYKDILSKFYPGTIIQLYENR